MNRIKTKIVTSNDKHFLDISIDLIPAEKYQINILSGHRIAFCESGYIQGNDLFSSSPRIQFCTDYLYDREEIEMVISYMTQGEIMRYEPLKTSIPQAKPLEKPQYLTIQTKGKFDERSQMASASKAKKLYVRLSVPDDIEVNILEKTTRDISCALGNSSASIMACDFVTTIPAGIQRFKIPLEVFLRNREKFQAGEEIGLFELIKADFHSSKNVFYKQLISNILKPSDFPKDQPSHKAVVSPVGEEITIRNRISK